jgi:hypothetical protein
VAELFHVRETAAAAEQATDGDHQDVEQCMLFCVITARVYDGREGLL